MLSQAPVVTQIPVVNMERALDFYQNTLGLKIVMVTEDMGMAILAAGGGTQISLYQRGPTTADHTVAAFVVADVYQTVEDLMGQGVVFEQYNFPGLQTDAMGVAQMGPDHVAWFKDTEGNILAVGDRPT